jgi:twitching motility protein PilT
MLDRQARRLGEFLVERHVLSRDNLEVALAEARRAGEPLPVVLRRKQLVGEKDLTAAIADALSLRFVDFGDTPLHPDASTIVPPDIARRYGALGVDFEDRKLVVAFAEPADDVALQAVGGATGYEIIPATAGRYELAQAIDMVYGVERVATATNGDGTGGGAAAAGLAGAGAEPGLGDGFDESELHVNALLEKLLELRGSDLHLTAGSKPIVRVHGELRPLTDFDTLNGSQIREMLYAVITQKQREKFENELELDTSYTLPGRSRFRMNVFLQRDSVGAVLRAIPYEIVAFDQLGLPPSVEQFAELPRGLVLVTGPTGSGKSTTLASLVDIVNRSKALHIMTVEDPIEFLHQHKRSVVNQREVGEDTHSFANALKHVLRQDPDVILVGEMRDLETISTALTAAETGHLVFATLHTQSAPQTIDRVIDVFPAHQQGQVRAQLSVALMGVMTQQLLPTADGSARVAAIEALVPTPAVRNLIREAKTHQITSVMQTGGQHGMQTMEAALATLVRQGTITTRLAETRSSSPEELKRLMSSGGGVPMAA